MQQYPVTPPQSIEKNTENFANKLEQLAQIPPIDASNQPQSIKINQQMYEDLIDSYDEEIESEMDDYLQTCALMDAR